MPARRERLTAITADIVSAYAANNNFAAVELPEMIGRVHAALLQAAGLVESDAPAIRPLSAAEIAASIRRETLVSFLNGKPYKTLKRHLASHGLSPHAYRQRFGLPNDYPMVADAYRAERARIARDTQAGAPSRKPRRIES